MPEMTNTPDEGRCALRCSGTTSLRGRGGAGGRVLGPLRRLNEALPERPEVGELGRRQFVISITEIRHRVVEPLCLVRRLGANDAAPHNVLEHLVAGLLERRGHRARTSTKLLFGHEPSGWGD